MRLTVFLTIVTVTCLAISCDRGSSRPEGFEIEKGFALKLVAQEPLIKDPVDLEFNEKGEAMVLEMPGYPFEDKQSRIVILKDENRDGAYDNMGVFAENLQLASSFLPYKKGVLVAAPPYLLYVQDLNEDSKADKIDTLMGGFSTGNLQHNFNGLTYGLDNWIYSANGGNDGEPYWWNDTTSRLDLRGQDFRFDLESRTLERLGESSGGFGLAMNEYGHVFETHNLEHISHLVFPDRYIKGTRLLQEHTLENISDHEENGLARIYPIGEQESRVNHPEQSGYFSGSCGITYYGGGAFGPEYENTIWVADVVLNLIHVDQIAPHGASFKASRVVDKRDFLASTDRSFRPVNMTVGPDGALYVVDMYRKVIEHPEWIPDEIEKTLDLEAGKDKGRIYRIAKEGVSASFDFSQFENTEGLISSLSNSNQWVRKSAHRLLASRHLSSEELNILSRELSSSNKFARLHSMWLLAIKEQLTSEQLIKLISDSSPDLRASALVVSEKIINTDKDVFLACMERLNDKDSRVRMHAALALSTLNSDQFLSLKAQILQALAVASDNEMDGWQVAAITLAAKDAAPDLFSMLSQKDSVKNPSLLSALALVSNRDESGMKVILEALSNSAISVNVKRDVIHQLAQGSNSFNGKTLSTSIQNLEKSLPVNVLPDLAALRNRLQLPPSAAFLKFSQEALVQVLNQSLSDTARLQQMALLELLPYKEKSEVLYQCLNNTEPLKLQEAALRQLSKYREPEIGWRVVKMWKGLGPQTRRYASDLLLYIETNHDALLTGIEDGTINIGEMNFDLERRRMLLWWTDNENTKRRAEKLFSDAGVTNRKEAIEKMKPALALVGSSVNGEKVFESICSSCHKYGSKGNEVGPVLTEINRKSKESIMHDILDPNAAVDTKYINHRLETKNGDLHMGIVAVETDQYITLKKIGGEKVTVTKSEIKSFTSMGTSLMMEGLENSMTHQEMADLLAFLQKPN